MFFSLPGSDEYVLPKKRKRGGIPLAPKAKKKRKPDKKKSASAKTLPGKKVVKKEPGSSSENMSSADLYWEEGGRRNLELKYQCPDCNFGTEDPAVFTKHRYVHSAGKEDPKSRYVNLNLKINPAFFPSK